MSLRIFRHWKQPGINYIWVLNRIAWRCCSSVINLYVSIRLLVVSIPKKQPDCEVRIPNPQHLWNLSSQEVRCGWGTRGCRCPGMLTPPAAGAAPPLPASLGAPGRAFAFASSGSGQRASSWFSCAEKLVQRWDASRPKGIKPAEVSR